MLLLELASEWLGSGVFVGVLWVYFWLRYFASRLEAKDVDVATTLEREGPLATLASMGYALPVAAEALRRSENDADAACGLLCERSMQEQLALAAPAERARPPAGNQADPRSGAGRGARASARLPRGGGAARAYPRAVGGG